MLSDIVISHETRIIVSGVIGAITYGAIAYALIRIMKTSASGGIVLLVAGLVPVGSLLPRFIRRTPHVFGSPSFTTGLIQSEYELWLHLIVAGTIGIVTGAILLYRDVAARRSA